MTTQHLKPSRKFLGQLDLSALGAVSKIFVRHSAAAGPRRTDNIDYTVGWRYFKGELASSRLSLSI
jgi:hypothetical protein